MIALRQGPKKSQRHAKSSLRVALEASRCVVVQQLSSFRSSRQPLKSKQHTYYPRI